MVTGESYKRFLTHYCLSMLPNLPPDTIFRQNGAPSHYSLEVRQLLNENMPDPWIGIADFIRWLARAPDLISLEFFI